jgi:hypothetical protein
LARGESLSIIHEQEHEHRATAMFKGNGRADPPGDDLMYETAFTPFASLGGGVLIGLAAVLLMLALGRVMGATGILAGLFAPASIYDFAWRAALLLGMVTGPTVYWLATGAMPEVTVPVSTPMLDHRRPDRRRRRDLRLGLHLGPRRLRHGAALAPLHRRHAHLHGLTG